MKRYGEHEPRCSQCRETLPAGLLLETLFVATSFEHCSRGAIVVFGFAETQETRYHGMRCLGRFWNVVTEGAWWQTVEHDQESDTMSTYSLGGMFVQDHLDPVATMARQVGEENV